MKKNPIIYILDDDVDFLNYFSIYLKKFHYQIEIFSQEEPFKLRISNILPDICFVDINLTSPGSGFETIQWIKSIQKQKPLVLIALSARQDDASLAYALELGVTDYLVKPLDPSRLINKLIQYTQINQDSYLLNETSLHLEASAILTLKVLEINLNGLLFVSDHLIMRETRLKLKCVFLNSDFPDGIMVSIFKTILEPHRETLCPRFIHDARFVDMNESTQKRIKELIESG